MRVSNWHPPAYYKNAYRLRGRPPQRWDGLINNFARDHLNCNTWQDAINDPSANFPMHANAFIIYAKNTID